jgi:hypothetical protein
MVKVCKCKVTNLKKGNSWEWRDRNITLHNRKTKVSENNNANLWIGLFAVLVGIIILKIK